MNLSQYFWPALSAFALSFLFTPWVIKLAHRVGAIDTPGEARRIHKKPTPRLGGLAIYGSFLLVALTFLPWSRELGALLAGMTLLVIVGVLDDIHSLSPWVKLIWQIAASLIALSGGIGITDLTNPFGGIIMLNWGRTAFVLGGLHFHITPLANLLSILWMVGLINTVNFLDGLDGLATGVSAIAASVIFLLAIAPHINQPAVAMLAIILAGAAFGFLPYNFFPARIFVGDSGAYLMGLTLAMLAIYSGAKLATVSLVLGFTILDGIWTVLRRVSRGVSPFRADRGHFHHLLFDAGLSQRQAVLTMYAISMVFGGVALLIGSHAKLIAALVLIVFMTAAIFSLAQLGKRTVN
jgi:UDP-GlcNAc:undecaprenyl-phosphate GlcNAc-1-phosphate transferase